jgi:hypothetical protein
MVQVCVCLLRSEWTARRLPSLTDSQFETKKLYYQLDPLSRRSLLVHPPNIEASGNFGSLILSSARSGYAREQGLDMRALGGGEGGIVDLARIKLCPGDDGNPVSVLFTPRLTFQIKSD